MRVASGSTPRRPAAVAAGGGRGRLAGDDALVHRRPGPVDGDQLAVAQRRGRRRAPTTHGTPSSRVTIAAWQVMPPPSVTTAAARRIVGTQSGVVIGATRTSPSLEGRPSFGLAGRAPAGGRAGRAASPAAAAVDLGRHRCCIGTIPLNVVIGRDCTRKRLPPANAHSMSCGSP